MLPGSRARHPLLEIPASAALHCLFGSPGSLGSSSGACWNPCSVRIFCVLGLPRIESLPGRLRAVLRTLEASLTCPEGCARAMQGNGPSETSRERAWAGWGVRGAPSSPQGCWGPRRGRGLRSKVEPKRAGNLHIAQPKVRGDAYVTVARTPTAPRQAAYAAASKLARRPKRARSTGTNREPAATRGSSRTNSRDAGLHTLTLHDQPIRGSACGAPLQHRGREPAEPATFARRCPAGVRRSPTELRASRNSVVS